MPIRRSPARMAGLAAAVVVTAATGLGVLAHLGIVITHGTSMWPGIRTRHVPVGRPAPRYPGAGEPPRAVLGGGPASPRRTGSGGTRAAPASAGTAPATPHPAGPPAAPRPAGRRALPANPLPTAAGRPGRRGVARLLAALAVAALGSAAALALWVAPAPATATAGAVATPERLAVSYRGDAPPGAAYPGGLVSTGDPVFITVLNTLAVAATYTAPA